MKRILFVDDDQRILDALRRVLRQHRHEWEMVFVSDGASALAELAQAPFDVIVSDLRMPKMDGAMLLAQVRERHPQTVRIILSGHPEAQAGLLAAPVAHQFLTKPCGAATLQRVIERACNLQALLENPALRQLVGEMGGLPSSPRLYSALTAALSDPEVSVAGIARIVEQDVAMTAKCLQLVNSAFFGLVRRITTIQQAVAYLGMDVLRNLVFSTEAFCALHAGAPVKGFSLTALERHSSLTASIAVGLLNDRVRANAAFLAAMLHDIGKLVLATRLPKRFGEISARAEAEARPLHEVEGELFGVTHAEIGAYLLGLWGVPYPIVEAVACHHCPERVQGGGFDLLPAIYVANVLAHECTDPTGGPGKPARLTLDEAYLDALGVLGQLPGWRAMAETIRAA